MSYTPVSRAFLTAAGIVVVAIVIGTVYQLSSFSTQLDNQIRGIPVALASGKTGNKSPFVKEESITTAPKEEIKPGPSLGMVLNLTAGTSVSVPVELAGSVLTMKLTLVSIEKYGTANFRAKVLAQTSETPTDGAPVTRAAKPHTFALTARSFSEDGFDVVMAGYSADSIVVVMDYKAF